MPKADLEGAKSLYPSCSMKLDDWVTFFATSAGLQAMGRILYDIYDERLSIEEREAGHKRIGRRPARSAVALHDVMTVVKPEEFSTEPINIALEKLLRGKSRRQFARKVPINQTHLGRILNGKRSAPLELIERIARAAGVQPWHFMEWRAQYIAELVEEVFFAKPSLSVSALKNVRTARMRNEGVTVAR